MKSWTQGCALETRVEVEPLSQAISKGHHPHALAPEALQNAAPVSRISIMGARGTFARITIKIARGLLPGFPIKIAKEIIALVFNQGSSESVSKRILKVQACLKMALDWR